MTNIDKLIDIVHQQMELIRLLNDVGSRQQDEIRQLRNDQTPQWMKDVARAFDQSDCTEAIYLLATGTEVLDDKDFQAMAPKDYGERVEWLMGLVDKRYKFDHNEETGETYHRLKSLDQD